LRNGLRLHAECITVIAIAFQKTNDFSNALMTVPLSRLTAALFSFNFAESFFVLESSLRQYAVGSGWRAERRGWASGGRQMLMTS